ncbi:hypothetical protein [Gracilibacillus alcaliphilus]|uniref:hypothetical protein n=1 Tax=Gracilibacillus alcaliphilus TaxID=1401441 RepID=UPI00195CAFD1|nr:hypothetical protein [Gracilibacillus alcaliphilus]MBM7675852.1 hypothetical protein [Gracilibacillus alcaliphilus]
MKKTITMLTSALLLMFMVFMLSSYELQSPKQEGLVQAGETEAAHHEIPELSDQEIVHLTDTFMDLLVQEVDEQYKVKDVGTKVELMAQFEPYVLSDVVEPFIDFYYTEQEDGLYILPTETPPWFVKDQPYETKVEDEQVKLIQHNQSPLHGEYTLQLTFQFVDGAWKIADIIVE